MPRLTPADELFVHQIPEPLPNVVTFHDHWRESYFFVVHHPETPGDVVVLTMAHFPKREEMDSLQLGIVDGNFVFGRHVRPYDGDPHTTAVGPATIEIVEVGAYDGEQPAEVPLGAGLIPSKLDLRHLGFDQAADLQAGFSLRRRLAKQVGVARKLDLVRDFQPVAMLASVPFILVVHPSLPAKSVKELVALAKARPGQINYASTGSGSSPHLTAEMLKMQARIDVVHVPYKGTPLAVTDLLTGQVSFMFANALSVLPQVGAGRLRALGITSSKRSATTPQLPTMAESGLPGFESGTWYALLAPAGTPREVVARLAGEVARLTQNADLREKLAAQGAEALTMSPEETAAYIKGEIAKWGKVVRASGAKVE